MRKNLLSVIILILIFLSSVSAQENKETVAPEDEWIEVAIFVHGINPSEEDSDSDASYHKLLNTLKKYYGILGHLPFDEENVIFIRYGTLKKKPGTKDNISDYLTAMQNKIGEMDSQVWDKTEDDPPSMLRSVGWRGVRKVLLYGVSDAFYYNSPQGGNEIRRTILLQIMKGLVESNVLDGNGELPEGKKLSVTIFAHSLGGIVMYDILQTIFIDIANLGITYPELDVRTIVDGLHKLKNAKRLRVRKLYTFGTQISMMFFKYNDSLRKLKDDELQDISSIFPEDTKIKDPRWINFWDKDDILGYPFDFLFKTRELSKNKIIKDIAVDAGDYLPHVQYWENERMSIEIIKDFLGLDDVTVEFLLRN